jgi:hypothetical protein
MLCPHRLETLLLTPLVVFFLTLTATFFRGFRVDLSSASHERTPSPH